MKKLECGYYKPDKWNKAEYETIFYNLLRAFCEDKNAVFEYENGYTFADLEKDTQSTFYAALMYIYSKTFEKSNIAIKDRENWMQSKNQRKATTNNIYNYDAVSDIADIYIKYCGLFNKIPDQQGFIYLTGIKHTTLNSWFNSMNNNSNTGIYNYNNSSIENNSIESLNDKRNSIIVKIKSAKRAHLEARTTDGKQNPVGCIAILNNEFYNVQKSENGSQNALIGIAELPTLAEISEN